MKSYKDHLELLKNTAMKIASAETPQEVTEVVLNTFESVLMFTTAALIFFDESMSNLNIFRTKGMNEAERKYVMEVVPKRTIALIEMIKESHLQPVVWNEDALKKGVFLNPGKMKLFFWLPIIVHGKPIGVMSFSWRNHHVIAPSLMEFFSILGNLLGGELQKLQRNFRKIQAQEEKISALKEALRKSSYFDRHSFGIVGNSPKIKAIHETILSISDTDVNVLIEGETGTGKELIADYIHYLSQRNKGPFVKVNCGALSEMLLESELFGHVKGAFTGAYRDRMGRFEMAENGTLFLDEIGETSQSMQIKLLRVLQEGIFEKVGSSKSISTNARIICATNKNLKNAVEKNEFRRDLYFRLDVISIKVPPLRERAGDIPLFFNFFIDKFNEKYKLDVRGINKNALDKSCSYSWPGNVRELENIVERAVITYKTGIIEDIGLPDSVNAEFFTIAGGLEKKNFQKEKNKVIERFEREYIAFILKRNDGSIMKSAQEAGLDRKNFYLKMKKYNIHRYPPVRGDNATNGQ
ncbi:MAG: sigma-54-dependent Fis family transcriptional regulator [Syntrophales bacterium]